MNAGQSRPKRTANNRREPTSADRPGAVPLPDQRQQFLDQNGLKLTKDLIAAAPTGAVEYVGSVHHHQHWLDTARRNQVIEHHYRETAAASPIVLNAGCSRQQNLHFFLGSFFAFLAKRRGKVDLSSHVSEHDGGSAESRNHRLAPNLDEVRNFSEWLGTAFASSSNHFAAIKVFCAERTFQTPFRFSMTCLRWFLNTFASGGLPGGGRRNPVTCKSRSTTM